MKLKLRPSIKRFIESLIILLVVFGLSNSTIFSSNSLDIDEFKDEVGFVAMVVKNKEEKPVVKKEVKKEVSKAVSNEPKSYETSAKVTVADDGLRHGSLTGYSADCPLCGGRLACVAYDVYRNGVVTYPDAAYGNVRIVASSRNLPCGSIVAINSSLTAEPMVAIVLDRGVGGNNLDLLVASEAEAYNNIGRKSVTYSVLRNGW